MSITAEIADAQNDHGEARMTPTEIRRALNLIDNLRKVMIDANAIEHGTFAWQSSNPEDNGVYGMAHDACKEAMWQLVVGVGIPEKDADVIAHAWLSSMIDRT
jgi:hypothetical protein